MIRAVSLLSALLACATLHAQEATPSPSAAPPSPQAILRAFTALGLPQEKETYSVTYKQGATEGVLFDHVRGCARSGFGTSGLELPPGHYEFTVRRDGAGAGHTVRAELKDGASYFLFAVLQQGRPVLGLEQESPVPEDGGGIYIYNLLPEPRLGVSVGGQPSGVPFALTPTVLSPDSVAGQPVALVYPSRRKSLLTRPVDYAGTGRVTAVFLRNEASQPSVLLFTAPAATPAPAAATAQPGGTR